MSIASYSASPFDHDIGFFHPAALSNDYNFDEMQSDSFLSDSTYAIGATSDRESKWYVPGRYFGQLPVRLCCIYAIKCNVSVFNNDPDRVQDALQPTSSAAGCVSQPRCAHSDHGLP